MDFRIADTFTNSLLKLTNEEQKLVKTTAFELQLDPSGNGNSFHKLDRAKDSNFWSVRVNADLRIIVHRLSGSLMLCYAGHHEDAYDWASRRKLTVHPQTGAAQIIEVKEVVQEIVIHQERQEAQPLFVHVTNEHLLRYGVPEEWLTAVKAVTSEDGLFQIIGHLPQEASEALIELAAGNMPPFPVKEEIANSFEHPDAQRRFRLINNQEELEQAFAAPWEKWIVFLHPEQRKLVEKKYNGPARVAGSAGTGKTVVALHRAVFLAKQNPEARVLLTTFSIPLANALKVRLNWLLTSSPKLAESIEVTTIGGFAKRLYRYQHQGVPPQIATDGQLRSFVSSASKEIDGHKFPDTFLLAEWKEIVDARQITTLDEYIAAPRLGRKSRLTEVLKEKAWQIFEKVNEKLNDAHLLTMAGVYAAVENQLRSQSKMPYDYIIADEAQDISVPELKLLAVLGRQQTDSLFFAGDNGQRIFQSPFSWKQLGINIQGRSSTLRINYRTSQQIRKQADRLLPNEISDADGNTENRKRIISVFHGPNPQIILFDSPDEEIAHVAETIQEWRQSRIPANQIGIFVRSANEIDRAAQAVQQANEQYEILDDDMQPADDVIAIGTMHRAKGLEYRTVIVMACDEDVLPSLERLQTAGEKSDQDEIYNTERYLLYVAATRAREQLLITAVEPGSEFLEDLI